MTFLRDLLCGALACVGLVLRRPVYLGLLWVCGYVVWVGMLCSSALDGCVGLLFDINSFNDTSA